MSDRTSYRHVIEKLTPQQAAEKLAAAEAEHTPEAKAANLERLKKLEAAMMGNAFAAVLRRGISSEMLRQRKSSARMAEAIGIDVRLFEDFRTGDATLPSDVIERLVEQLGLHLMAEVR